MKQKLNLRKILTWLFLALLGWKFLVPIITGPIERKEQEIALVREGIEVLQTRMANAVRFTSAIRNAGKQSLPADVTVASIRYQEWLRNVCQQAGIESPMILVKDPAKVDGLGNKFQASIRTTSRIAAVGDLLDLLCSARLTHRIMGCKLHDWESVENKLQMDLEIEALSLSDNPSFDPSLFSQSIETRGLGLFLDERRCFSRFAPVCPRQVEIIVSAEEPHDEIKFVAPHKTDVLALVRFVGMLEKNGSLKALFRDSHSNKDLVVALKSQLQIPSFEATLERVDDDQATFSFGSQVITVKLGHTIRESIIKGLNIQSVQ